MRRIALLLSGSLTLSAQSARQPIAIRAASAEIRPATPALGFVPAGDSLRPVMGVRAYPGLGLPQSLGEGAVRLVLAPDQQYVLVQDADGRWSAVSLQSPSVAPGRSLDGFGEHATVAAISPSGSAAAFYREDTRRVEVLTGVESNARLSFSADLGTGPPLISLAVNDAGDTVLAGVSDGASGEVLALRPEQPATPILRAGLPSAIVFAPGKSQAVVADRMLNQVISVDVRKETADVRILAGDGGILAAPDALAIDAESSRVFVVNRDSRSVLVVSLDGKASSVLESPFQAAGIAPMREKNLYVLWSGDGRAAGLIRTDSDDMRISFIPAVEEGQR